MKPAAASSNAAARQSRSIADRYKFVYQTISDATPVSVPLSASILKASIGKTKSLLWCPPLASNLHESSINEDLVGRKRNTSVLQDNAEQLCALTAACTWAKQWEIDLWAIGIKRHCYARHRTKNLGLAGKHPGVTWLRWLHL
jgi:hypothetical protein